MKKNYVQYKQVRNSRELYIQYVQMKFVHMKNCISMSNLKNY